MNQTVLTLIVGALIGIIGAVTFLAYVAPPERIVVAGDPLPQPANPPAESPQTAAEAAPPPATEPVATTPPATVAPPEPTANPQPTATPVPTDVPTSDGGPSVVIFDGDPARSFDEWLTIADRLSPSMQMPSDCGFPGQNPESLPNADRSYRGGVHQGIDFICGEMGRDAVAAMDGRVVMAMSSWTEPSVEERGAVLDVAISLGRTPIWTLGMLFGRFVVLDHGNVEGVGHVYSIYAHLAEVDPAIRQAAFVGAGTRLGEIGRAGTNAAAANSGRPQSLHLHWELFVGRSFLGQGLTFEQTSQLYSRLFGIGG